MRRLDTGAESPPSTMPGQRRPLHALLGRPDALLLGPQPGLREHEPGHFHPVPELFLQVAGRTRFQFPQAACWLAPGQVLLLPPLLQHDERVRSGPAGEAFCNLVLQADGNRQSCHLAHEARAQRLLRETAMPVKQVAWACGFASPGYFAQCFRQQQGLAPQAWRAQAVSAAVEPAAA